MQINFLAIIGVGLAMLFVGYFVGISEGRPKAKRIETPSVPRENNLLKLSLDPNNQLRLEVDGQRAEAAELTPEQRKRLIELMVTMRPWIDASAPKPPPSTPITAPVSQPVSRPIAPVPAVKPVPGPKKDSKKEEPAAPTSMVGQIDAILQAHLADSLLANRGVRLIESPEGGVVVMVGLSKYSGVGEVPDPQVQGMIRAAIAEWEKKYTPGG